LENWSLLHNSNWSLERTNRHWESAKWRLEHAILFKIAHDFGGLLKKVDKSMENLGAVKQIY